LKGGCCLTLLSDATREALSKRPAEVGRPADRKAAKRASKGAGKHINQATA
jgi:hypothetical protein